MKNKLLILFSTFVSIALILCLVLGVVVSTLISIKYGFDHYYQLEALKEERKQEQLNELVKNLHVYREQYSKFPLSLPEFFEQTKLPQSQDLPKLFYHVSPNGQAFQLSYEDGLDIICYYSGDTKKPLLTFRSFLPTDIDTWQFCWSKVDYF